MCLSVSEIRSCQGKERKFAYPGDGSWFVQTDKAWSLFFLPGCVQSNQHLRFDPTQQFCSGCISNPEWNNSILRHSPAPELGTLCLVSPTAATATNTVLCHCRDNGDREPQHCLPSWEGAQTAADLGGGCCFDSILQLTKMPQRKREKTQTCKTYTYLTSQEKYGQSIPGKQTRMAVCDRPRLSVTPFYSHTK